MSILTVRLVPITSLAAIAVGTILLLHPSVPAVGSAMLTGVNRTLLRTMEYGAHVAVFFATTGLLLLNAPKRKRAAAAVIAGAVAWSLIAEYAQGWVPHRSVDPRDAACNLIGVATAAWLLRARWTPQKTIAARSSASVAGA